MLNKSTKLLYHLRLHSKFVIPHFLSSYRNEQLQVTLWGHKADQFDENVVKSMKGPVVAVFAAMLVKQYLGIFLTTYKNNNIYNKKYLHIIHQNINQFIAYV